MVDISVKEIAAQLLSAQGTELEYLIDRYKEDPRKGVARAVSKALKRQEQEFKETNRVQNMYQFQRELGGAGTIVGIDEVGRGPLAGPLTVAAVVLPDEPLILGLNDSKKLSPARRVALAAQIEDIALAIGISHVEPASIDAVGMAVALRQAMSQALQATHVEPDSVLIDGNPVHIHPLEKTVVKGDAKIAAIAAASIVAKVARDDLMVAYDAEYPGYGFAQNKGYGSAAHIEAIKQQGLSPIHRVSFCGNFLETPPLF